MSKNTNAIHSEQPFIEYVPDPAAVKYFGENNVPTSKVQFPGEDTLPYIGVCFAMKFHDTGEIKSYFKADADVPFDDSIAKKLLDAPDVFIGERHVLVDSDNGVDMRNATKYMLPLRNPGHAMFAPSVYQPVSDAINVDTDYVVEILFAFEDGFVLPVYTTVKTEGPYSVSSGDIFEDILRDIDSDAVDFFKELSEKTWMVEYHEDDDVFVLHCSNREGIEAPIELDENDMRRLRRNIVSMRIVEFNEKIK